MCDDSICLGIHHINTCIFIFLYCVSLPGKVITIIVFILLFTYNQYFIYFQNKVQCFFFDVAVSTKFELAIVILIFLNMCAMAIEHYHQVN